MVDSALIVWFILTGMSVAYVAWDAFDAAKPNRKTLASPLFTKTVRAKSSEPMWPGVTSSNRPKISLSLGDSVSRWRRM